MQVCILYGIYPVSEAWNYLPTHTSKTLFDVEYMKLIIKLGKQAHPLISYETEFPKENHNRTKFETEKIENTHLQTP